MPNDLPYMQFYVNDFDGDTCGLSSSAVGVWIRLLIAMHRKRSGELSGTLDRLAKMTRCTVPELESALAEFETDDICYMKRDGNGVVTVVCRRLKREEEKRVSTSERVRRFRERKAAEQENADCNADVTPLTRAYSQSQSHKENIHSMDIKESPPASRYPSSVEEVLKISKSPTCGVIMSLESADRYFTTRMASDWIDAKGRRIEPKSLVWDIKKWVMNEQGRGATPAKGATTEPWRGRTSEMEEKDINGEGF